MSRLSAAIRSLARASAHPESLLTPATPAVSSLAVRRAKAGQRRYASGPGNRIAKQRYNFNTSLNYTGEPDENVSCIHLEWNAWGGVADQAAHII